MCQLKSKGPRCQCDTSENRRIRRRNANLKNKYAGSLTNKATGKHETTPVKEVTVESIKSDLIKLHKMNVQSLYETDDLIKYEALLNKIGENISTIAETKYGAPTNSDFLEIEEDEGTLLLKRIEKFEKISLGLNQKRIETLNWLQDNCQDYDLNKGDFNATEEIWREKEPEKYSELEEIRKQLKETDNTRHQILEDSKTVSPEIKELFTKRNEAIVATLKEVGVKFADPKTLIVAKDSNKTSLKALHEALQFYPQAWVDASNNHILKTRKELRIKTTTSRSGYNESKGQKRMVVKPIYTVIEQDKDWQPDPTTVDGNGWHQLQNSNVVIPGFDVKVSYSDWGLKENEVQWARVRQEYSEQTEKPRGLGWQKVELRKTNWNGSEHVLEDEPSVKWKRIKTKKSVDVEEYTAELKINPAVKSLAQTNNDGTTMALHEFAHRVESSAPEVLLSEKIFLHKRIGTYNGTPEQTIPLRSGKNEIGYKDDFIDPYVGRKYNHSAYEIFSVGMETLFSGTYGGFVGIKKYKEDNNHKNFIIGLIASTVKDGNK